jgi:transcriptional regulator with XRE-family HTH domain
MGSIADWIKKVRLALGVSQERFAMQVGVEQPTVSRWENGIDAPDRFRYARLIELAKEAGVNADVGGLLLNIPTTGGGKVLSPVVGYVGAGAEVYAYDDHALGGGLDEVDAPVWMNKECVAVRIRGESMYPLRDGWLLFYARDASGVPEDCVGELCIVKLADDGPTLVKEVRRGTRDGHYHLQSWNAPVLEDQRLEWAARVLDIRPTR